MADLASSIFSAFNTLQAADTGAGGLAETNGATRLAHFVRMGDPDYDGRSNNWPMVKVEIICNEQRSFSNRHADAIVRLHVYEQRDVGFSRLSDVNTRIVAVYDRVAPATVSPFSFSVITYQRHFQAPSSGIELHHVHEFSLRPMV